MQFVKERLGKWITAAIILVVGILCIVAGAQLGQTDPKLAATNDDVRATLEAISLVLGISFIVVGSLSLVMAIVVAVIAKKGFALVAIPGAAVLAIGISLVVVKYADYLIILLLTIIPYLLVCIGAVIFADAVFNLVMAIINKNVKNALVGVIVGMVVGAVAIVLGSLCLAGTITLGAQLIVFGIIVCLFAVLQIVLTFVKVPDAVIAVVKVEKKEEAKEEK